MAARFLFSFPPRKAKRWTEARVDPEVELKIATLLDRLFDLKPVLDDEERSSPKLIRMTSEAKAIWKSFYNQHAREQAELEGDLSAAWSKHEAHAARIALILHMVESVMGTEGVREDEIDHQSMANAITIIEWFKYETKRIYSILSEGEEEGIIRRLIGLIERKGGSVTTREVMRSSSLFDTSSDAERAMSSLTKQGWAKWEQVGSGKQGGRPTRRLTLTDTTIPQEPNTITDKSHNPVKA